MRIWLGGIGDPIPVEALPDAHHGDAVPVIVMPDNGETFVPDDYIPLGYTHYEVWCVGACGGLGASPGYKVNWTADRVWNEYLNPTQWAAHVAKIYTQAYYQILDPAAYDPITNAYRLRPDGSLPYIYVTAAEYAEIVNPAHDVEVIEMINPQLTIEAIIGGGGGGGGLQVVTGRLDELPSGVLCTVGEVGADAPTGQGFTDSAYDPVPTVNQYGAMVETEKNVWEYPFPHPELLPPGPGDDGGASSFGTICEASGGKGGGASTEVDGASYYYDTYFTGAGGDGGTGGTLVAGGGGVGSKDPAKPAMGKDGSWDPDTRIGHGGGGGHGGIQGVTTGDGTLLLSPGQIAG